MWAISYLSTLGVLQVKSVGAMDLAAIKKMITAFLSELADHDLYRSLIDLSEMDPGLTLAEIHELVTVLKQLEVPRTNKFVFVAPTDPESARQVALLCELATRQGFILRVAGSRDAALAWLSGITCKQETPLKTAAHYSSQCFDAMLPPFVLPD